MPVMDWTIELKKDGKTYFYEEDCEISFDYEKEVDCSGKNIIITVLEISNSEGFKFNTGFMGEQGITERLFAEMVSSLESDERFNRMAVEIAVEEMF